MASSASEDEKIMRDLEELEQLKRKEAGLQDQLERTQKAIKNVEKRLEQKRGQFTERPHQSRRQAVNLSCLNSWRQEEDVTVVGQLTRSHTISGIPLSTTSSSRTSNVLGLSVVSNPESTSAVATNGKAAPPSTVRTKPSTLITDASRTYTAGPHSDDESSRKDSSVDGMEDPPRKMAYKTLVARKYAALQQASHLATLSSVTEDAASAAPQSATGNSLQGPSLLPSLSYAPTTALDAKMTLERINLVRGFKYALRTSLLLPDSLTATMIEWPALMPPTEVVRLFESLSIPHSGDCRCSPTTITTPTTPDTAGDSRVQTPSACEKLDIVKRAISAFVGAAIIAGFQLGDLQEMWEVIQADRWISRYIVKRDRDLVRLGASVVLERIEKELSKLDASGSSGVGNHGLGLAKGTTALGAPKLRHSTYDGRRGSSATIVGHGGRRF
ncbi:hypothetical protein FRC17_011144 [Serendipita sp. 399]|nr:hypothetical protein FRC17_011144 [Serendipita sp. 399]